MLEGGKMTGFEIRRCFPSMFLSKVKKLDLMVIRISSNSKSMIL